MTAFIALHCRAALKGRALGIFAALTIALVLAPGTAQAAPPTVETFRACWKAGAQATACKKELRAFLSEAPATRRELIEAFAPPGKAGKTGQAPDAESIAIGAWLATKARIPVPSPVLIEALLTGDSTPHQQIALGYLEVFRPKMHYEAVVDLAGKSRLPKLRAAALRVLQRTEVPGRLEVAREAVRSPNPMVQAAALRLLGQRKDKESLDVIARYLCDPQRHISVRIEAAEALRLIDDPSVAPLLFLHMRWPEVGLTQALISAFAEVSPAVYAELLGDYLYKPALLRVTLMALAKVKDAKVAPKLIGLLEDPKLRSQDLRLVFWALWKSNDRAAEPALISQLKGSAERAALAAEALGQLRAKSAIRPLIAQLEHPNAEASDMALWALVRITDKSFEKDRSQWDAWLSKNPF